MLGFFSGRPNWDPIWFRGGTHSLAGERVGGSQFGRGDRHCGTLGIYVLKFGRSVRYIGTSVFFPFQKWVLTPAAWAGQEERSGGGAVGGEPRGARSAAQALHGPTPGADTVGERQALATGQLPEVGIDTGKTVECPTPI